MSRIDEVSTAFEPPLLDPRGRHRVFLYGALAAAVLSIVVILGAILELQSARDDVGMLTRRADRSTFLIGDIGRQLARMQLAMFHALDDPPAEVRLRLARAEGAGQRIDANLRQLEPLLSRAERKAWPSFTERLARARDELDQAGAALRDDDAEAAAARLDEATALMRALQEQVDTLAHLHEGASERLLDDAGARLSLSLWIIATLGLLLFAGGAAIWTYAFRAERARRDLEQSLHGLARNNQELDIFAGRAAHDIRNLLAPVSIAARSLDAVSGDAGRVKVVARQLRRASERALDVLDGLLAFARSNAASEADTAQSGALVRDEVAAALEDLRPRLATQDVTVDARVDDGEVSCDPRLLRIVVTNLLDNALKFAGGARHGHVCVRGRQDAKRYSLEIEDDGPGIPANALERLFEPFYRVDGSLAPGTGLGLATVQRIVEAHGGVLEVESRLGEGALFRVRLPRAGAIDAGPQPRDDDGAAPPEMTS